MSDTGNESESLSAVGTQQVSHVTEEGTDMIQIGAKPQAKMNQPFKLNMKMKVGGTLPPSQ